MAFASEIVCEAGSEVASSQTLRVMLRCAATSRYLI